MQIVLLAPFNGIVTARISSSAEHTRPNELEKENSLR